MNLLVSSLQDSMFFLTNGPVELYKQPGVIISPFVSIFGLILDYIFRGVEAVFTSGTLGVSIILFTIISRILLLPLAAYQTKAMMKMKVLQPDIKKVQEKYKGKNDIESKQKMQAEISEVQKKHGASPLAGCLPLLIQMPIIYALFFILRETYIYIQKLGQLYSEIAALVIKIPDIGPLLTPIVSNISTLKNFVAKGASFDIAYSDNCRFVISKISEGDWNTLLAAAPPDIAGQLSVLLEQKANIEYFCGINLVVTPSLMSISVVIVILSGLSTFLSTLLMNKMQGNALDEQARLQQKTMLIMMPVLMAFMSFTLPSGLSVYWITGNIIQAIQQYFFNNLYDPTKKKKSEEEN